MASSSDIEGGYPPDLFVIPFEHDEFNCAICFDIAKVPIRCSHDHLFCACCIGKWLVHNATCPVDRGPLTTGEKIDSSLV
jgi:hypothetical protein